MRYFHHESRRRQKLKLVAEYLRNNCHLLAPPKNAQASPYVAGVQLNSDIHKALRTGSLSQNLRLRANERTGSHLRVIHSSRISKQSPGTSAEKKAAYYQKLEQVKMNQERVRKEKIADLDKILKRSMKKEKFRNNYFKTRKVLDKDA